MKPHVIRRQLGAVMASLLDLPGLLKTKQSVRPKDQMDAAVISRALEKMKKRLSGGFST
ncbi:MAG: hypothetical protein ABR587_12590 [Candidatus Binatia bacterium]